MKIPTKSLIAPKRRGSRARDHPDPWALWIVGTRGTLHGENTVTESHGVSRVDAVVKTCLFICLHENTENE